MKVAVLGPSDAALNMTHELLALGASVRLFWGPILERAELVELSAQGVVIAAPWQQVTKRFLLAGQKPPDTSRFADLFRVSFRVNPEPLIQQGLLEQPEVYQKLSDEFMASLKGQLEMFEDVDVVIDASPGVNRRELGPGGPTIGEDRLRIGTCAYAGEQHDWTSFLQGALEVAIIGDGAQAAQVLVDLREWWQNPATRIFHITTSPRPFAQFFQESTNELGVALKDFLAQAEAEQQRAIGEWEAAVEQWLELDDFIKAKKPKPEKPIPRLVVFSGHIVSSVDQLVDKSRSFLTLETSPFFAGEVQVENNELALKTIGVDRLIGATGTRRAWERFRGIHWQSSADLRDARESDGSHPELGFFTLTDGNLPARRQAILSHLQKLFSPRGAVS